MRYLRIDYINFMSFILMGVFMETTGFVEIFEMASLSLTI